MTGTQTTEVRRNTGKDILIYIALLAVAVLSVVVYLWISFSPPRENVETAPDAPWDLAIMSVLPPEEDDLQAIRALDSVERIELGGESALAEVFVWISGTQTDQAAYEDAVSTTEAALASLAAQKEAARVEALHKLAASAAEEKEKKTTELAELTAMLESLEPQAQELVELRQKLDAENAALLEEETRLSGVRTGLNRDGEALSETEAEFSTLDTASREETYQENARQYRERRDAWYAGGEDYLDVLTSYELKRRALDREEQEYASRLADWEAEKKRLEDARAALEAELSLIPEPVEIEDCTWQLRRNPEAGKAFAVQEEEGVSPLRLAMQMLFLAVAALAVWLFFARLLSTAAGTIVKPKSMTEETAGEDATDSHAAEDADTADLIK